jgi:hypothetical protein
VLSDDLRNPFPQQAKREAMLRRWRTHRFLRFDDRQQIEMAWKRLSVLAHVYGQEVGTEAAYQQLRTAILRGQFDIQGKSKLLYTHPWSRRARMTPEWLGSMIETFDSNPNTINIQYVGCCWVPTDMAVAWWHGLPGHAQRRKRGRPMGSKKFDLSALILVARDQLAVQPQSARSKRAAAKSAIVICGWEPYG